MYALCSVKLTNLNQTIAIPMVSCGRIGAGMDNQSWKFAVEIEQLGDEYFVRVIEDGRVAIRAFDRLSDAETFAEGERARVNVANVVRR